MHRSLIFKCLLILILAGCQTGKQDTSAGEKAVTVLKPDWTGTYYYAEEGAGTAYQLKLHRRSVDASYEMQYMEGAEGNKRYFKEYIFDVKDIDSSIIIRFLKSYSVEEKDWPYKNGDTLFVMNLRPDSTIYTEWKAVKPKLANGNFRLISKDYH